MTEINISSPPDSSHIWIAEQGKSSRSITQFPYSFNIAPGHKVELGFILLSNPMIFIITDNSLAQNATVSSVRDGRSITVTEAKPYPYGPLNLTVRYRRDR